jgi:hypothetical protein
MTPPPAPFLASETALADFIQAFEQGTWPKSQWTHAAHLAMAAWYLLSLPKEQVTDRVRLGIQHYNAAVGVRNTPDAGYHETLTLFWLGIVSDFLARCDGQTTKLAAIREVVDEFGSQRDLSRGYYGFDVVKSREARARWMPPDDLEFPRNKNRLEDI